MERSKRKEMEFQLRRNEILHQAERIFSAKGFYNTTMAEIADASGFAIGTLYLFFESKEKLYTAMINEKLDLMYSEIRGAVNGVEKTIDKIEMLVRAHFYFVENNVDICNLLIRGEGMTLSMGNTVLRDKIIADYVSHIDFIEGIMHRGIEMKSLKVMESRIMALAILGIIRSFFYDWMLSKKETPLGDKVDPVLDIFLKGVKSEVTG
ncbi:MAG: TetR/AcrR family transcriptional regulator [Deltaproteobacteria bacterium]|nr:TetR/AcrR family transcriptional regulator [Deltaproteobacteria bacterium]